MLPAKILANVPGMKGASTVQAIEADKLSQDAFKNEFGLGERRLAVSVERMRARGAGFGRVKAGPFTAGST